MPRIEVEVTHGDRVLFPDPSSKKRITKRDVVDYYCAVAATMLPHLKGRPLNVQRFPAASTKRVSCNRISLLRYRIG